MSLTIEQLIRASHETAIEHGWWDGPERSVGDQFANFHAELAEAWEEYRKTGMDPMWLIYFENHKPEGLAVELADVLIRIFDTCGRYNIPLEKALVEKLKYNQSRPYRHGNKLA